MIAWLSDWLRDIIAVILLAVMVELLLPNKAMQRYARLVVGLFILLTILSPVLRLVQSDLLNQLDDGVEIWDERAIQSKVGMTRLSEIKLQGERLGEQRNLEAAKLTERTLEQNMRNELIKHTNEPIDTVDVTLNWINQSSGDILPAISGVIVTLSSADAAEEKEQDSSEDVAVKAVEAVRPVDVQIELEPIILNKGSSQSQTGEERVSGDRWINADNTSVNAIRSILVQGWGVEGKHIIVRQEAGRHIAK